MRAPVSAFALFAHAGIRTQRRSKATSPLREAMRVAVVGCAHGQLDALYAAVREAETVSGPVDLVVCPGDFQAIRNAADLSCMACPQKFRSMNTFWKYYSGEVTAPVPTVFVGGNHEAPNHLQELPYGGLVAPNMYYLGDAGVVNVRGLRIAGVSGVYVRHHYYTERNEQPPYPRNQVKSVYHARARDIERLMRLERGNVDIMLSHDWPQDIAYSGDTEDLLKRKPFLRKEIEHQELGHPGTKRVLQKMRPRFWFAAHMHVKFAGKVQHSEEDKETRFLALDKIVAKRDFLQILEIPVVRDPERRLFLHDDALLKKEAHEDACLFELDPEWLAVLRSEAQGYSQGAVTDEDVAQLKARIKEMKLPTVCNSVKDFERTAPIFEPAKGDRADRPTRLNFPAWTKNIAAMLGVELPSESPPPAADTVPVGMYMDNTGTGGFDANGKERRESTILQEGEESALKKLKLNS